MEHANPPRAGGGDSEHDSAQSLDRRGFLQRVTGVGFAAVLLIAAGMLGAFAARFLFPRRGVERRWQFVARAARLRVGESISYLTPGGAPVSVARLAAGPTVASFVALSSTCPHLGCRVHWEAHRERFFCPCHNGAFDPTGKAVAGPPLDDKTDLARFPLKLENGLLFIQVPVDPHVVG